MIPREASHPRREIIIFFRNSYCARNVRECTWTLPSPFRAFSQSLSVNSLRLDHTARNDLAARNNEAEGLGNVVHTARQKHDSDSYATRDATIDDVTVTAKQIYDISDWQSQ